MQPLNAQQFSISTPSITTCSGVLEDTGSAAAEYGHNESFTTTICSNTSQSVISLNWFVFNLSLEGTVNDRDRIEIWDGNSTNATFLGRYTGNELTGLFVSPTSFNTSGCLTVRFTSNGSGAGNFAAGITCIQLGSVCDQPTAISTTVAVDTVVLCLGDTLFLDGSNSISYPGTTITEWKWTTGVSAPLVTYSPIDTMVFTEAGVVALQLVVTSSENCVSTPTEEQIILVSGPVSFLGTIAPGTVCIPGEVDLVGNATLAPFVQVSFTGAEYGPGLLLPDILGVPFVSTATNYSAPFGSTVTDPSELGDICLEMEHSFIGDFVLELACPNGQSVLLHQQGGLGTFLGDANDSDPFGNPVVGTCWQYCFNTNPDHGTWVDCSESGVTPNVIQVSQGNALAPGSYSPITSLDSLIGCPFNGEWSLKVTDLWAADNGFLCSWSLGFTVEYDSSYIGLSGSLDLQDPAQTFWSGPNLTGTSDPTIASVPFNALEEHDYTFTVIDSYGCLYDTTVTIRGHNAPMVDAGVDVTLCGPSAMLVGSAEFGIPDSCSYLLRLRRTSSSSIPSVGIVRVIQSGDTLVFGYINSTSVTHFISVIEGGSFEILYTAASGPYNTGLGFTLTSTNGTELFDSGWGPPTGSLYNEPVSCAGIIPPTGTIFWTPQVGLDHPNSDTTTLNAPAHGWYTLTVGYPNGCSVSDSIFVTDLVLRMGLQWNASDSLLCADQSVTGAYQWFRDGELFTTTTTPCLYDPPIGWWYAIAAPDSGCVHLSDSLLTCPEIFLENTGTHIHAIGAGGLIRWTLNGDTIQYYGYYLPITVSGEYTVTSTLSHGCVVTATMYVDVLVGMDGPDGEAPLRIIPNPTNGTFRLMFGSMDGRPCMLEIRDLTGRLVYTKRFSRWSNSQAIDVEHLSQGNYFVQVVSGEEQFVGKLILER